MPKVTDIKSYYWSPKQGTVCKEVVEGIYDIHQAVANILNIRKRSIPHHPEFGSNLSDYIDYPTDAATPHVIRESVTALQDNEPRTDTKLVEVDDSQAFGGQKILNIEWTLKESTRKYLTTVRILTNE